ncbi:cation diffusion facilitator family transporter [Rhodoflexus caldus]|uniref:cation diffusion facilitator family transporter n=1 Tax=Rhodoflexus caldus TaxID=2891236 RepID=UPI002029FAA1|nr:cation diffusion facilitator family transporter [Rhodoflexus caldus]
MQTSFLVLSKKQLLTAALIVGSALALVKFVAYYLTSSDAIFTDALESIVNVVAGAVALYSVTISAKPRDKGHPYGHGKIEFLSSGFEAVLIMLAGAATIGKAIYGFWQTDTIAALDTGIALTVVTGSINYGMGYYLRRQGRKMHSPSLQADGEHLMSDGYTSLGLIIGLALIILTGWEWLDGTMAIIFGGLIIWNGWQIFRHAISGVMDETDEALATEVIAVLQQERRPNWIDVHNLRIIKYGPQLHIDCHLTLPWYLNVEQAHDEVKAVEDIVNVAMENRVEIFIHTDPCVKSSCAVCTIADCAVRKAAFVKKIEWTKEIVMQNSKHEV